MAIEKYRFIQHMERCETVEYYIYKLEQALDTQITAGFSAFNDNIDDAVSYFLDCDMTEDLSIEIAEILYCKDKIFNPITGYVENSQKWSDFYDKWKGNKE